MFTFTKHYFNPISLYYSFRNKIYSQKKFDFSPELFSGPLELMSFVHLLNLLYKDRSGFVCELDRADETLAQQKIFLTYGEIMPEGLNRLFEFIKPKSNDVFVDLGSGSGKLPLQAFLCTDMCVSYGIEIDGARYKVSQDALAELKQQAPFLFDSQKMVKQIDFYKKNIVDCDLSNVSIIFANSVCWGANLMGILEDKINASKVVRAVMSTKRLENLEHLTNCEVIPVETSWHQPPNTSNCYVYYR